MIKQTLLEIVQDLLSAMDSEEVNNISDTTESLQVARIVRGVFYDCASDLGLLEHEGLFELNPSGDPSKPVIMYVPDNVSKVYWIKYNTKLATDTASNYRDIASCGFNDFFQWQSNLDIAHDDVEEFTLSVEGNPYEFLYKNNKMPERYTSLSNSVVIFDSIDMSEDTTLQKNKTMCGGLIYPDFLVEDEFIPPFDPGHFPYFINRCKVRAFNEIKQVENREAAAETKRQKIATQKSRNRLPQETAVRRQRMLTGYGRTGR